MAARVSVVIPTWNQSALLRACLASLDAQTYRDFEVIVADDGSQEDIAAAATAPGRDVRVVRLEANRGFAAAANTGLADARGEWLFLLNNDVTLEADCLARLMAAAGRDEGDILGPLVLHADDRSLIYSAGDRIRANGRPESIGFREPLAGFAFDEAPFGISGGWMLIRREVIERVGPFDECFLAYFEDADLMFRARLAGYRAALVPEALAYHVGAASIAGRLWWRRYQCLRNHALLVLKNYPAPLLLRHGPRFVREHARQIFGLIAAVRCERGLLAGIAVAVRARLSILAALPHVWRARRRIRRFRRITTREVASLLR